VNEKIGYMFMVLEKDWYRPGEKVSGKIFFELFMHSY
jgi:hypothetical protein